MARESKKPWYRKDRGYWCIEKDGKLVILARGPRARTRDEAMRAFKVHKAAEATGALPASGGLRVGDVCRLYCEHAARKLAPLTAQFYARHLGDLARRLGGEPVAGIKVKDITDWLDGHDAPARPGDKRRPWGQSTRSGAIACVKRAFRWAARQGHIPADPMVALEKPRVLAREAILTADQARAIRAAVPAGDPFGDLLDVLRATGCRPSEAYAVEARHVDAAARVVVIDSKTTASTGRKRVIHLTAPVAARLAELAREFPEGPILRAMNWHGRGGDRPAWNRFSVKNRFQRAREKLGLGPEATAESYRHLYATDALEAGVPIATVAELMGHTSTRMLSEFYSKLRARSGHLRDALDQFRGGPGDQDRTPHSSGEGNPGMGTPPDAAA